MTHRREAEFDVEVVDTVERIDRKWLDALADDFCYTYGWFKTVEALETHFQMEPRYIVVYKKGRMVAFVPAFLVQDFPYFSVGNKGFLIRLLVNLGERAGFHLNHGRTLVCDPPDCLHSRVLMKEDCDPKTVLNLVSAKIDEICKEERIPMSCFTAVSEFEGTLRNSLEDLGYFDTSVMNSFYLDILWSSFDEYVESLEYGARKDVRREIRKFNDSGVIIEEEYAFERHAATLSSLWLNTYSRHRKDRASPVDASYFTALGKYAKDDTRVYFARKKGEITGFCLCLRNRDTLDVDIAGFDYDSLTKTDFTYFNICYYVPIRWAIEHGIRRAYYRFGTDEVKLRRGCKIERLFTLIKFHNRLLRSPVRFYLRVR
jgi:predicted N-acyltransferase